VKAIVAKLNMKVSITIVQAEKLAAFVKRMGNAMIYVLWPTFNFPTLFQINVEGLLPLPVSSYGIGEVLFLCRAPTKCDELNWILGPSKLHASS
jgi:hypothetical protein